MKKDKSESTKKSKKKDDDMGAFNYDAEKSSDDDVLDKSEESNDNLEMETLKLEWQ